MPNRILKSSICSSDSINSLGWFEEVLFYRLIVTADDYGRFDGRAAIIKGACFPLKDGVRNKQIEDGIKKLSAAGMVVVYEKNGKPFLQLTAWESHQSVRAKSSKYPEFDSTCTQLYADDCRCPRIRIRESRNENDNKTSDDVFCPELKTARGQKADASTSKQSPSPVIILPLNTGEHEVTQQDVDEWVQLYPAVDVMQELRNMRGWLNSNLEKRKTSRGINRFITNWLQKEQNKARNYGHNSAQKPDNVPKGAGAAFRDFPQRDYDYNALMQEIGGAYQ